MDSLQHHSSNVLEHGNHHHQINPKSTGKMGPRTLSQDSRPPNLGDPIKYQELFEAYAKGKKLEDLPSPYDRGYKLAQDKFLKKEDNNGHIVLRDKKPPKESNITRKGPTLALFNTENVNSSQKLTQYQEEKIKSIQGFLEKGILSQKDLKKEGILYKSSVDSELNDFISVNILKNETYIKDTLYSRGYGALSVVAEKPKEEEKITIDFMKKTSGYKSSKEEYLQENAEIIQKMNLNPATSKIIETKSLQKALSSSRTPSMQGIRDEFASRFYKSVIFVLKVKEIDFLDQISLTEYRTSGKIEPKYITDIIIPNNKNGDGEKEITKEFEGKNIHFVNLIEGKTVDLYNNLSINCLVPNYEDKLKELFSSKKEDEIFITHISRL